MAFVCPAPYKNGRKEKEGIALNRMCNTIGTGRPVLEIVTVDEGVKLAPKKTLDEDLQENLSELTDEKGYLSRRVYVLAKLDSEGGMEEVFQIRPWREAEPTMVQTEASVDLAATLRARFKPVKLPYLNDGELRLIAFEDEVVVRDPLSLMYQRYFVLSSEEFQRLSDAELELMSNEVRTAHMSLAPAIEMVVY